MQERGAPNWIAYFRALKGLSREDLAKAAHVSFGQVTKLERGERKLTQEWAEKLAGPLGCRAGELLDGPAGGVSGPTGVRVRPGSLMFARKPLARSEQDATAPENVAVPELDPNATAGSGGSVEILTERLDDARTGIFTFPAAGFRELYGAAPEDVVILPVKGDSMEPTLRPGQRVMVNLGDKRPSPPGVFVVWDGLGIVIKRVEFVPHSAPPAVRFLSDNPRHGPYERLLEEAYIQGRVIGCWERR